MNEELKEKLKLVLKDHGIDEETTVDVLAELEAEPKGEGEEEAVDTVQQEGEETAAPEEATTPEEGEVPTEEGQAVETPEPQPTEEQLPPPAEPQPGFDPTAYDAKIEELQKANEGLISRIESLEDALRKAGVIEGDQKGFGFAKEYAPDKDPSDDGLESFLMRANRKSY